jgi:hypothetical protein
MRSYIKFDVTRVYDYFAKNGFVYAVHAIKPKIAT